MKKVWNLLLILCVVGFFAACNQSTADKADSSAEAPAAEETQVQAEPAADAAADATASDEPDVPKTSIKFESDSHDFGTIDEGDKVSHKFAFTNSGDEPLIINSAKGSCGCTVPEWPKEPIPPGESGEILVEFNSKGKKNKQTKTVTINANTDPNPTRLTIKADVTPAEPAEAKPAS